MTKVSILVPTMNRSEYVIRLLEYYSSVNSKHPIYIGDASNQKHRKLIVDKVEDLKKIIDIHYFHWPKYNDLKTLEELVKKSKEKFCSYIGDDDFLIPTSLEKCANFLDKNKNFRTAQGKAMIFHFNNNEPFGDQIFSGKYWNNINLEQEKSSERLTYFSKNYWTPVFSVKRTNECIQDLKCYGSMPDKNFGEIISNLTFISRGKSKFLDCLYLIRQGHNQRYIMKSGTDWIKSPLWNKSLQICIESLSLIVSDEDKISYQKANIIVNKVLDEFIIHSLKQKNKRETIYQKTIRFFKNYFIFSKQIIFICRFFQSIIIPERFELSQMSIMKKSSKFYSEFKPVYEILTRKN